MAHPLNNCQYDKIKLLYKLSSTLWFISKHAQSDAHKQNDAAFDELLKSLQRDLEKHVTALKEMTCK